MRNLIYSNFSVDIFAKLTLWWFLASWWGWNFTNNVDGWKLENTALSLLLLIPGFDHDGLKKTKTSMDLKSASFFQKNAKMQKRRNLKMPFYLLDNKQGDNTVVDLEIEKANKRMISNANA